VVREGAVRLEEALHRVDRQALENRRQHRAGHPVRCVDHHAQRSERRGVDEGERAVHEPWIDVHLLEVTPSLHSAEAGQRAVAHVEQPRLAADGQRAFADDLHAGVLLRVVRGGHRDAAVEAEVADREIDHLRAHEPDVEHVGASVASALDHCRLHRGSVDPHVAADRDPVRVELLRVGATDRVGAVLVEVAAVDPAHVVRLEDGGVEHDGRS
jgi:hypothetical protein